MRRLITIRHRWAEGVVTNPERDADHPVIAEVVRAGSSGTRTRSRRSWSAPGVPPVHSGACPGRRGLVRRDCSRHAELGRCRRRISCKDGQSDPDVGSARPPAHRRGDTADQGRTPSRRGSRRGWITEGIKIATLKMASSGRAPSASSPRTRRSPTMPSWWSFDRRDTAPSSPVGSPIHPRSTPSGTKTARKSGALGRIAARPTERRRRAFSTTHVRECRMSGHSAACRLYARNWWRMRP